MIRRNEQFEGTHISARLERGRVVSLRNKDNICSATIARGALPWGSDRLWDEFMAQISRETPFATALDFFESRGVEMTVSG